MRVWFSRSSFKTLPVPFLSSLDRRHCYLTRSRRWDLGLLFFTRQVKQCLKWWSPEMTLRNVQVCRLPRKRLPAGPVDISRLGLTLGMLLLAPIWGLAAVAVPAGFLKDVRTLPPNLAGHGKVNTPLTGLRDETQALATWSFHPKHPAPMTYRDVSLVLLFFLTFCVGV